MKIIIEIVSVIIGVLICITSLAGFVSFVMGDWGYSLGHFWFTFSFLLGIVMQIVIVGIVVTILNKIIE